MSAVSYLPIFVCELRFPDMPSDVVAQTQRCLLDLVGVAAAGSRTRLAMIVNGFAVSQMAASDAPARLLFDGRKASVAGAAFAGASTIDAFDAHDGHALTKGHAGVAVLPALLAYLDGLRDASARSDGEEFLTCLCLGYEVATRAGIALHATTSDYHCSGAWSSLACAAIGARLLGFTQERVRHALGIAEYLGPRGQILRVCDHPTMLKDGSGWGALAGVSAALLAREEFTGAPALTVERDDASGWWSDLGERWRMREQYFKPYPVCRWAQPAIEAVLQLKARHDVSADDVEHVRIESFREAIDLGSQCRYPRTTDEAQYSLPFPVAAALVYGRVGAAEIEGQALRDQRIVRLLDATTLVEDATFSARFPAERWARVHVVLRGGRTLISEPATARGDPEHPLSDEELRRKYRALAEAVLGRARAGKIEACVDALPFDRNALPALMDELLTSAR